jgi:hypothetical protein
MFLTFKDLIFDIAQLSPRLAFSCLLGYNVFIPPSESVTKKRKRLIKLMI